MKVAINQEDGKWPNLALAKLVRWHRERGDEVEFFLPLERYDRVYSSRIFTWTRPNGYLPSDAVLGGTGYDVTTALPDEVEVVRPDFSPWGVDFDLGFTTRGCARNCPFCIVPRKEGKIRVVGDFYSVWGGVHRVVKFMDNNATAAPIEHFRKVCADAASERVAIDFNQGLDCRLLTAEHVEALRWPKWHLYRQPFAFDRAATEPHVRRAVRLFEEGGLTANHMLFYVLIGFNTSREEDEYRVNVLQELGAHLYVTTYNQDPYQRGIDKDTYLHDFARWANRPWYRYSCSFAEFDRRLNDMRVRRRAAGLDQEETLF